MNVSTIDEISQENSALEIIRHRVREIEKKCDEQRERELTRLPPGFYLDDTSLWYQEPKEDEDKIPVRLRICSRLEIIAVTRNQQGEDFGRLLQWHDCDGRMHTWAMPMSMLASEGYPYLGELLSKGLEIEPGRMARQKLTVYIQSSLPTARGLCTPHVGWHHDCFVLPSRTIGQTANEQVILQSNYPAGHFSTRGTLENWQQIPKLCAGNSRLVFALSMSFASILLTPLGIESGGVHFQGTSSLGKTTILRLVQGAHTVSHFQKAVLKIGDYLIILAVVLVALIITVAIFRGDPILTTLQFALVLTVAAIPVAMPTVLSVKMVVGARLLARKEAIVSRLVAIEELAGVDVLCADKTGTLTQNKLTLGDPFSVNNASAEQVILNAALASCADNNDIIDLAVLGGLKNKDAMKGYQVIHFQPFDPVHKRTEATVKDKDGKQFKVTKGAPQVILALSSNAEQVKTAIEKAVEEFASRGFRSLGVARADGNGQWHYLGVLPLFDPPREDAKATIATATHMGVKVKMVTGDAIAIAKETSKTLGMGTNIFDATGFGDEKKQETAQITDSIDKADGFAEVFPEHKFHIIDVLQKRGHIVGMTGDGVNDAPALKKADCGIAVSGATDAAHAAADIVLLTSGLSVIIESIKESRKIFQRMNSYAIYRIAETVRVLFFMTLAILIFNFYPLTAVMIVMLALLNDGAILSIAYDNVLYKDQPEAWNMRMVLGIATVLGIIGVVSTFGLFYLGERVFHLDRAHIQTLMYLKLSVAGHVTIFLTRTRGPFWSIRPARILWIAVLGTQVLATLIAVYGLFMMPLGWGWALFVWGYALSWFLLNDRLKLLAYRIFDPVKNKPKPETKMPLDLRPQIARRAYELYEQRDRQDGRADDDWKQAEREIRKDEPPKKPR